MAIVLSIIIVGIFVFLFLLLLFDPWNTVVQYVANWKFRKLCEIRGLYLHGLHKDPPDCYAYFHEQAINCFYADLPYNQQDVGDLVRMVDYEQYIHHYFTAFPSFSGHVYHSMWEDYRTGDYCRKDYASIEILKKNLPIEIASSPSAFADFTKFVDAGWFDNQTGMFILSDGRQKQHIGRSIYWICKRNSISKPERVFAETFGCEAKTIKEWLRLNKNETITKQIDRTVFAILDI